MATPFETEMGVMPELSRAVFEMGWNLPTDIQSEAVPHILGGRDVLMAAETGSGKTGAFCLPILQIVSETIQRLNSTPSSHTAPLPKPNLGGVWSMNMYDRGPAMAIDHNTHRCQSRDQQLWHGCRAKLGVRGHGRWYYEATVTDEGLCRVGWATISSSMDLGTDKESYGYGGTGKKSFGKQFETYGEPFGQNDVIGCYLDLAKAEISWSKNGVDFGFAFKVGSNLAQSGLFPSICLKNAELEINFGTRPFKYPPKSGFQGLNEVPPDETVPSRYSAAIAQMDMTPKPNAPLAVIIEPSRELAQQTYDQMRKFKRYLPVESAPRDLLVLGSVPVAEQIAALKRGVHLIVATPGRLEDLVKAGHLLMSHCRFYVLDECDALLSQGLERMVTWLHSQMPRVLNDGSHLQVVICSATLHSFDVRKLAERIMSFPLWIDLKGEDSVPETVHHVVCIVDPARDSSWKDLLRSRSHIQTDQIHRQDRLNPNQLSAEMFSEAVKILKGEYVVAAIRQLKMDRAIIFCRTKIDCDNLESLFKRYDGGQSRKGSQFSCVCLHSDRSAQNRTANLEAFKRQDVRFLICTDVAARGIDVTGLPYVINVTLPDDKKNYIHRIGRVGRAERMGLAVSLVAAVKEKVWYHQCDSRGKNCFNTDLLENGGCAIWYNEPKLLGEVEEHLNCTIDQVDKQFNISVNEFDGKVVYGEKAKACGSGYQSQSYILLPSSQKLAAIEKECQNIFLQLKFAPKMTI